MSTPEDMAEFYAKSMEPKPKEIQRYVDSAMFEAEPIDAAEGPKVYLLSMTPDPLGAIAAATKMYKGEVVRDLSDVKDAERIEYFEQVQKTKLQAPFEFVQFHFMIEGVTRAFTHQMVRQRTSCFAQESLRFAVKEDMPVGLPPSIAGLKEDSHERAFWDQAVATVGSMYQKLVDSGVPAEDARGLLPHNVLTRLHYTTNLRALLDHAGNRLCTQAQFEWRLVFSKIVEAIRHFNPYGEKGAAGPDYPRGYNPHAWQFYRLSEIFRPVCYQTGKCEFKANFDRACSIRSRVDANENIGRLSSEWHEEYDKVPGDEIVSGVGPHSVVRDESNRPVFIGAIAPVEWLADPGAAR